MLRALLNPWVWFLGPPIEGWNAGLETFWPILVQGALVSVALGLIGCFLVVRGMSLLGDALSHSVLPGIALGFFISVAFGNESLHSPWILVGATAIGLAAAVLIQTVQDHSRVKEDASLGIIFTTLFAVGVVMVTVWGGQSDLDPGCVLYGDIVNFVVERDGIWPMAVITTLIVGGIAVFYRYLLVSTFDPGLAVSLGIPARAVHYVLMGVLSLTIVASFEAVGAILAVALLVMPGATARLWTDRMPRMLMLAALHGVLATLLGYWLSHPAVLNTAASGAICVAGFGLFLASWLLAPRHGLIVRWRGRRRLRRTMAAENLLKSISELSAKSAAGGADSPRAVPQTEIAADLRMPSRQFTATLRRAVRKQWITRDPAGIRLTEAGQQQSRRLVRAHELWEAFLRQEVGLEPDHVHDAAEWVEHYLDEERVRELEEKVKVASEG